MDRAVVNIIAAVTNNRRHIVSWTSVPGWLRAYEDALDNEWTPERDAIAALMAEGDERPSGISGIDPDYFRVKGFLVHRGMQAMEIETKRGLR